MEFIVARDQGWPVNEPRVLQLGVVEIESAEEAAKGVESGYLLAVDPQNPRLTPEMAKTVAEYRAAKAKAKAEREAEEKKVKPNPEEQAKVDQEAREAEEKKRREERQEVASILNGPSTKEKSSTAQK